MHSGTPCQLYVLHYTRWFSLTKFHEISLTFKRTNDECEQKLEKYLSSPLKDYMEGMLSIQLFMSVNKQIVQRNITVPDVCLQFSG